MNDYALNKELINQVLHEILAEKPTLLPASTACQCHFLDPNKLRMLLWKDFKDGQETYILKIAEQKFVGESRADRRGEVYWKFRELYESKEVKPLETKPPSRPEPHWTPCNPEKLEVNQPLYPAPNNSNRLAKFQERQAKAAQFQKASENNSYANNSEQPSPS